MWARVVGPLLCRVAFPIDFLFFSSSCISRKNDVAKSLGPFDIRMILESQKMQKQENLLHSVKTK
jgi:hypothetical protein